MRALRSSSRSRATSRSSFRTCFASRFPPEGIGPRFFASSRSDPSRAAFRHPDRCELYSPSRRSRRPISPGVSQASAFSMTDSLYAAVKRRLVAFAVTSGSGAAAALRLPSPEERGVPFVFIPSPRPILQLSASPYSKHFLPSCLALVGREGYTLFTLTRELRGKDAGSLSEFLLGQLDEQQERFDREPGFRLHQQNYRQVKHILARLTHWVETQCDLSSSFQDLTSRGRARPFEIEHIWADHYDRFTDWFAHPSEFETERNRLGGLLLLQRGVNQSIGDAAYEAKRDAYLSHGQNLLARSLHPLAYRNLPTFRRLLDRTGLPFRPYESFGPKELAERQELYIGIAERVWNPSRLNLDGEKPPTPGRIAEREGSR